MFVIEHECVDCGMPCSYGWCKYYGVKRYYCDDCKEEDKLYEFEGDELCADCVLKRLPKVEGSFY